MTTIQPMQKFNLNARSISVDFDGEVRDVALRAASYDVHDVLYISNLQEGTDGPNVRIGTMDGDIKSRLMSTPFEELKSEALKNHWIKASSKAGEILVNPVNLQDIVEHTNDSTGQSSLATFKNGSMIPLNSSAAKLKM